MFLLSWFMIVELFVCFKFCLCCQFIAKTPTKIRIIRGKSRNPQGNWLIYKLNGTPTPGKWLNSKMEWKTCIRWDRTMLKWVNLHENNQKWNCKASWEQKVKYILNYRRPVGNGDTHDVIHVVMYLKWSTSLRGWHSENYTKTLVCSFTLSRILFETFSYYLGTLWYTQWLFLGNWRLRDWQTPT